MVFILWNDIDYKNKSGENTTKYNVIDGINFRFNAIRSIYAQDDAKKITSCQFLDDAKEITTCYFS